MHSEVAALTLCERRESVKECPNCPKSRPCAAASSRPWSARASRPSSSAGRTCAFRFPERFAERLQGQIVTALGRRAKYLLADLSSGEVLVMHLGMTGRFLVKQDGAVFAPGEFHAEAGGERAHDHVVFRLSNGASVTYNDARRFGFMDLVPRARRSATAATSPALGIEPLGNELSGEAIARLFRGRKRAPLKAALLDQRLIAGLGNIYVCEALFRAGLHPEAPAGVARDADRPPARQGASSRRGHPRCAERGRRGRRIDAARLRAGPTARSAISSTASASTTARASTASRPAAAVTCGGSCRPAARPSICPHARSDSPPGARSAREADPERRCAIWSRLPLRFGRR